MATSVVSASRFSRATAASADESEASGALSFALQSSGCSSKPASRDEARRLPLAQVVDHLAAEKLELDRILWRAAVEPQGAQRRRPVGDRDDIAEGQELFGDPLGVLVALDPRGSVVAKLVQVSGVGGDHRLGRALERGAHRLEHGGDDFGGARSSSRSR
ncbi:MAG: hypothetical protein ACOX6T_03370 [Myxococcales bacterium]